MRRTNCASADTCRSCSQGSRLGRCRCVPTIVSDAADFAPRRSPACRALRIVRRAPDAGRLERQPREQRQRASPSVGAVDLERIGGLQVGEQLALVRPELREHDHVGGRRREISLERAACRRCSCQVLSASTRQVGAERPCAAILVMCGLVELPAGDRAAGSEAEPDVHAGRRDDPRRQKPSIQRRDEQRQAGGQPETDEVAGQRGDGIGHRAEAGADGDGRQSQIGRGQHGHRQPPAPGAASRELATRPPTVYPHPRLPDTAVNRTETMSTTAQSKQEACARTATARLENVNAAAAAQAHRATRVDKLRPAQALLCRQAAGAAGGVMSFAEYTNAMLEFVRQHP